MRIQSNNGTLSAIGNGRIGIRGDNMGIFLAGFYDELPRPFLDASKFNPFLISWSHLNKVAGYKREVCIVNCPDFLAAKWIINGKEEKPVSHKNTLDIFTGELTIEWQFADALVIEKRFASMQNKNHVFQRFEFKNVSVELEPWIDTQKTNFNISGIYQDTTDGTDEEHIRLYDVMKDNGSSVLIRGRVQGHTAAFATRISACGDGFIERISCFECDLFHTSPLDAVHTYIKKQLSYEQAKLGSDTLWKKLWHDSDITIKGDDDAQLSIRYAIYQLLISASPSEHLSVPAKGIVGEGYRGMVFWDTDIHMLPFYTYTQPELARNIVKFRLNTLDKAIEKARDLGCEGACYPWETGYSGEEECEDFLKLLTHQLHITADVAYGVDQYLRVTKDATVDASELFLQTAQFWLSKGTVTNGVLSIPDASGPDELHLECNDNAYMLNMAEHNLQCAKKYANFNYDHIQVKDVRKDGIFEQCEGFFGLRDEIVYEDDPYVVPADTQTVKQADVIMMLYLLPHIATNEELLKNWNYYEPRTTHTSSLSYGVHGIIAAKLNLSDKALYYLNKSLQTDLSFEDKLQDGPHLAAAGMSWAAVVFGFAGVTDNGSSFDVEPHLPSNWSEVKFCLKRGGKPYRFKITKDTVECVEDEKQ